MERDSELREIDRCAGKGYEVLLGRSDVSGWAQSNEATGVGKEPVSCDDYSDGIWHTHVVSSGTGTGKWTMTDQSMAIDDGSSTCRKKVMLQLLTAYMNLLGNI
uniref:Uncharacterized protein n=1 Tax=Solanum lycopersicum TaxID=4081 RepID=A0A3Q7FDK7_SOLLC